MLGKLQREQPNISSSPILSHHGQDFVTFPDNVRESKTTPEIPTPNTLMAIHHTKRIKEKHVYIQNKKQG